MPFALKVLLVAAGVVAIAFVWQRYGGVVRERWDAVVGKRPRIAQLLPPVLLAVITLIPFASAFIGEAPISHDHPVHLARAWHFVTHDLGHAQLRGWSDVWFAGWPAGYDYPMGGDLWVTLFYLPTFGLLGWPATYGIAVAAMYVAVVLAYYTIGRVYFGRGVGFVVGLLGALDRGGGQEGGWDFTIEWGVWPFMLGIAFVLYAFAALDSVIKEGRARDYAVGAMCVAFSILCHPFALVVYGFGVPLYTIARLLGTDEKIGRVVVRCVAVLALGGALAAFWALPFSANGKWFHSIGDLYLPVADVAARMWSGTVYDYIAPPIVFVAFAAAVYAFVRRQWAAVFFACFGTVALYMSTRSFVEDLDLGAYSDALMRIPYRRMAYIVKPALFVLCGFGLFAFVRAMPGAEASWKRRLAWTALAAVVIAPLLLPLADVADRYTPYPARVTTSSDDPAFAELREIGEWARARRGEERRQGFYRIGFMDGQEDHLFKLAAIWTDTPSFHTGFTPSTTYLHRFDRAEPEVWRLLNVRYLVTHGPQRRQDLEIVRTFGSLHVYRFTGYSRERFTLEGGGEARAVRFDPSGDGMEIRVQNAAPSSRLVLHVGNFGNWRATRDGRAVEIRNGTLAGHTGFIEVPAENGTYRFEYVSTKADVVGWIATVLALLVLIALGVQTFRPQLLARVVERVKPLGVRLEDRGREVAIGIAVLAVLGVVVVMLTRPAVEKRSFVDWLDRAEVAVVRDGRAEACDHDGHLHHQCTDEAWNYVGLKYQWFRYDGSVLVTEGEVRRCIWAHPVAGADLRIRLPGVVLGRAIEGNHALMNRGTGTMSITAYVGSEELGTASPERRNYFWTPFSIPTDAHRGDRVDLDLVVRSSNSGPWHYCFDAAVR